jgi:hypothetical protein
MVALFAAMFVRAQVSPSAPRARDGVEEQRVGGERLAAVLRAEAEEVDAPLTYSDLDERGLAANLLRAEEPARKERRARVGVARDDFTRASAAGRSLSRRRASPRPTRLTRAASLWRWGASCRARAQDRAGAVELRALQALGHVAHGEVELLDGEVRSVVERDERPALLDELAQSLHALLAQARPSTPPASSPSGSRRVSRAATGRG